MLTIEQIKAAVKSGRESKTIDGRDYIRLMAFFPMGDAQMFGLKFEEGAQHDVIELTRENVLAQLEKDVEFGFQKALDQRGISASSMSEVVLMWMWVLEDELQHDEEYAQYGLPLLKKVAVKYGFPNAIGEDHGDEDKYAC